MNYMILSGQVDAHTTFEDRLKRARLALKPPATLNLIEWANQYRGVASKTSASPGKWHTNAQPVAFGMMAAVTDPHTHTVTVMAATQVVKTELLINVAGYYIHQEPSSILFVQPTQQAAENFSKERFGPTVDVTAVLAGLIEKPRLRGSEATITHKPYPGGSLDFVGSNSPTDLSSRPKRIILSDEIDKYPPSAGEEGDPLLLAEERASTYQGLGLAKFVRTCSPTVKEVSRIGREYAASDQRRCFLRCPHCDQRQQITWKNIQWEKRPDGKPNYATAAIACGSCGVVWSERERIAALDELEFLPDYGWRQMEPFYCCGERRTPSTWTAEGRATCGSCGTVAEYDGHAGFQVSKLYSKRHRLSDVVREFYKADGNPQKLKKFTNTALAELWDEAAEKVDQESLIDRARQEGWFSGENEAELKPAPAGVLLVTCGIDVQGDRLEIERVGWGVGDESWSLDHHVIFGDPADAEIWKDLNDYLLTPTTLSDGREVAVAATAIDSGGHSTDAVYSFVRGKERRRVWAIKGSSTAGRPVWPKLASKNNKGKIALYIVGTDSAKDMVYGRLKLERPGPGYCHFPIDRDVAWFEQLTSEGVVTRYVKGFPVRVWVPKLNTRQEALDCRVYAFAALRSMSISWGKVQRLLASQQRAAQRQEVVEEEVPHVPASVGATVSVQQSRPVRRVARSSFLGR